MARYYKNPQPYSKTLDQKYTRYFLTSIMIILGFAAAYWYSQTNNLAHALLGYALAGLFMYGSRWIFRQIRLNDQGSNGEWEIKKILETLSDDYAIFQNVPIRNRLDVDFVLVGPSGVYAIEVKSHRRFRQYGMNKDFIGQTLTEALSLKKYLKNSGVDVYVDAVLVFSRAFVKFGFTPQRGVYVIGKKFLMPLLARGQRISLDQAKIEQLVNQLYTKYTVIK